VLGFLSFFFPKNEIKNREVGARLPFHFQFVQVFGTNRVAPQQSSFPSSQEQNKVN
jgi:hypothetical protein